MNIILKHFSHATIKPRIIKNLRIVKNKGYALLTLFLFCISLSLSNESKLVGFFYTLPVFVSFTFDFPRVHQVMLFWRLTYSWHYPYSQQAFGH